jgi:HlyD family secretion protein
VVSTGELIYTTGRAIDIPHQDGGTIETLQVAAGDHVRAGQVLATMNPNLLDVEYRILIDRLVQLTLQQLRYQALLDEVAFPTLPEDIAALIKDNPDLMDAVVRERAALRTTMEEWEALRAQYAQETRTLERTIAAQGPIIEGLEEQEALLLADFTAQSQLLDRGVARRADVSETERDLIDVRNTLLQARADLDNSQAQLETIQITLNRDMAQRKADIAQALSETAQQLPEVQERLVALEERRQRLAISAPVDGVIDELAVAAEGVILLPGSLVATLVPTTTEPRLLTRIQPTQIDQVRIGQQAVLRPMTRGFNDTELQAEVTRISDSVRTDPTTGMSYYEVTLRTNLEGLESRGFIPVTGTPFEVAIQTSARTPLAYFMEPVKRSFRHAMRE